MTASGSSAFTWKMGAFTTLATSTNENEHTISDVVEPRSLSKKWTERWRSIRKSWLTPSFGQSREQTMPTFEKEDEAMRDLKLKSVRSKYRLFELFLDKSNISAIH
jgi:hypothetical protein